MLLIQRWRRTASLVSLFLALCALLFALLDPGFQHPSTIMLFRSMFAFIVAVVAAVNFLTFRLRKQPLLPIWRDAKEEVVVEIGRLQEALRAEEDEDLQVIVDFGLYGICKQENVRLMAALTGTDKTGTLAALAKVADAVEDYQAFRAASPVVALLERTPFGVSVPMRKTLLTKIVKLAA